MKQLVNIDQVKRQAKSAVRDFLTAAQPKLTVAEVDAKLDDYCRRFEELADSIQSKAIDDGLSFNPHQLREVNKQGLVTGLAFAFSGRDLKEGEKSLGRRSLIIGSFQYAVLFVLLDPPVLNPLGGLTQINKGVANTFSLLGGYHNFHGHSIATGIALARSSENVKNAASERGLRPAAVM